MNAIRQSLAAMDLGITEYKIAAILTNGDILDKHRATAAQLFNVEECKVTAEQRAVGKQRNYLILYGEQL